MTTRPGLVERATASLRRRSALRRDRVVQALTRTRWPDQSAPHGRGRTTLITVTYNTAQLVSQLIFSVHRSLERDEWHRLVVVDNGSTDDTLPLLRALDGAGLITLIARSGRDPYHASGLNEAFSFVAKRQNDPEWATELVGILDSDVMVLRPGGISAAAASLRAGGAAILGQFRRPWPGTPTGYAHVSANLIDPQRVWRRGVPEFRETGAPGLPMQQRLHALGEKILDFPFYRDGWLVHPGHLTLHVVADERFRTNRHHAWARQHPESHFEEDPRGPTRYRQATDRFLAEVTDRSGDALIAACSRNDRIAIP